MTSLVSAITADIREYRRLCAKHGEQPVFKDGFPDPYCEHAQALKKREGATST